MKVSLLILGLLISVIVVKSQDLRNDHKIIGDSLNIYKSVDDILRLKDFQNKVVYVDIWGTRCGPCLGEFKFLPELKDRFKNDSIEFLYLCCPYDLEWDSKNAVLWRELIKKHHLTGTNILMSAECYTKGFFDKYKDKVAVMYLIPTYLLVDKQGNIVDFNAPRPSSKNVLYDKIELLLGKK